jgi:3-phosphoinositide dependent protein kinase-1
VWCTILNPFFVLFVLFECRLDYVMELASNGELLKYIRQYGSLSLPVCVFYTAEIVSALEYLHCVQGVIHRDLKPENILLSADWHIKLTDFGTAKIVGTDLNARSNSFLGTAEYISPELLIEKVCYKASDLWALGCVVYQMIAGRPPFRGVTEYQTFQKVQKGEIVWPQNFPEIAKDFISKLLVMKPMERLGARDYKELKAHPFFQGIQWQNLATTTPPPLGPYPQKLIWQENVLKEEEERKRREREEERRKWEKFLQPNEQIVLGGLIYKRRKGTVKLRQLILTDKPRLIYIDPKKMELKGEIPWSPMMRVEIKSDVNWRVHTVCPTTNKLQILKSHIILISLFFCYYYYYYYRSQSEFMS